MDATLKELMAEIFEVEESEIDDDFNPESTNNWDSLNNLRLITAIETEFNISFTMDEIQTMVNYKTISSLIKSK
ncbi:MAG: acyl carrier protein [Desulforhopalus sp.]